MVEDFAGCVFSYVVNMFSKDMFTLDCEPKYLTQLNQSIVWLSISSRGWQIVFDRPKIIPLVLDALILILQQWKNVTAIFNQCYNKMAARLTFEFLKLNTSISYLINKIQSNI